MGSDVIEKESRKQNTENHEVQKGTWTLTSELEILLRKTESWRADTFTLGLEVKSSAVLFTSAPAFPNPAVSGCYDFFLFQIKMAIDYTEYLQDLPPVPRSSPRRIPQLDPSLIQQFTFCASGLQVPLFLCTHQRRQGRAFTTMDCLLCQFPKAFRFFQEC